YFDNKGRLSALNEIFWAGLFKSENTVLWEPVEKDFYTYDPHTGIYVEESSHAIKRRLSERLLEASRQTNDQWLEKQRTNTRLDDITAQLRGIVEKRGAFSQPERLVHLANGVLRFREDSYELLPFSPEFISRNASPIVYDPKATCPHFLEELI